MSYFVRVYPHNDLSNLAHYHKEIVNQKVANEDSEGIALDCMSCIIALAFSVEVIINFVGFKKIDNWQERQPYVSKIEELSNVLGLNYEESEEPFATLETLKELRNDMAHGKPFERAADVTEGDQHRRALDTTWDQFLEPEFINHASEQVNAFESKLYELGDIEVAETLTSGFGSVRRV